MHYAVAQLVLLVALVVSVVLISIPLHCLASSHSRRNNPSPVPPPCQSMLTVWNHSASIRHNIPLLGTIPNAMLSKRIPQKTKHRVDPSHSSARGTPHAWLITSQLNCSHTTPGLSMPWSYYNPLYCICTGNCLNGIRTIIFWPAVSFPTELRSNPWNIF